jgi:hypothetical protein
VANEFKIRFAEKMRNITFGSCEKIIQAKHIVSVLNQSLTKMRAQKSGSAGDQYPFLIVHFVFRLKVG